MREQGITPELTKEHRHSTGGTAENGLTSLPRPPDQAFDLADAAARRVKGSNAPVRREHIRAASEGDPPVARLLRSSSVRLKLYLSLLWISAGHPHDTKFQASSWAELLVLDDPLGRGARKIHAALGYLEGEGLVHLERRAGLPSTVRLLDERGTGDEYSRPGKGDLYIQIPASFWTRQWISALTGPAVAIFLVLLDQRRHNEPTKRIWLSPRIAAELYGLSSDTWTRGTKELAGHGLIDVRAVPVNEHTWGLKRRRNTYLVNVDHLDDGPRWE